MTTRKGYLQRLLAFAVRGRRRAAVPAEAPVPAAAGNEERVHDAVRRLAGGLAHDLNNILLVVQGYADMARTEADAGAPVGPLLQEVSDATSRATRLVRDLLIIGQNSALSLRSADLNETIARGLGADEPVSWRPGAGIPRLLLDESLVERLVAVLLSWAREAGAACPVLRTEALDPAAPGMPGAKLLVELPGAVVPPEAAARLFEPYVRGAGGGKGPGLRLAVARAIALRFGGTAAVESAPAGGTRIVVQIPRGSAAEEQVGPFSAPAAAVHPARPSAAPLGAPSILLAEDDESLRAVALKVLRREGYTVLAARDGQEAVELYEVNRAAIGLLLLDDVMPRMGGRAVLGKIRALCPGIPAIMASGYAWSLVDLPEAADVAVLPKPWRPRELLEKVRAQLEPKP